MDTHTLANTGAPGPTCGHEPASPTPTPRGVMSRSGSSADVLLAGSPPPAPVPNLSPAPHPGPAAVRARRANAAALSTAAMAPATRAAPDVLRRVQDGVPFLCLADALNADAQLGMALACVAEAAAHHALSWTEPDALAETLAQAQQAGAHHVVAALKDALRLCEGAAPLPWQIEELKGHTGSLGVFSWGAGFVTTSYDNVCVWQQVRGRWRSRKLEGHTGLVYSVCRWETGFATASEDTTVRVWQRRGGQWHSDALVGHTKAVLSVCSWSGGLATSSQDETVRVWRRVGREWQSEALDALTGQASSVHTWGSGFITTSDNAFLRVWQHVGGRWQSEKLAGHTKPILGVCPLGSGFVTVSDDKTCRVWQRAEGRWQSETLPMQVDDFFSICPWGTGFVMTGLRTVDVWQRIGGQWESQQFSCDDVITGACAWGSGFVTACGQNTVRVWQLSAAASLVNSYRTQPGPLPLANALELGRLGAALQAWRRGERPTQTMVQAAVSDPQMPLAQLAYVADLDLRTATGETLVGAALQAGNFAAAAGHVLRGRGGCDAIDIEMACTQHAWAVLVALLAGQRVDLKTLLARQPRLLQDVDATGQTLVMAAFAAGHDGLAFDLLLLHEARALPHAEGSIPSPVSDALRHAATTCLLGLQAAGYAPHGYLSQAPMGLRAALLGWTLGRHNREDIALCLAATVGIDLAKDPLCAEADLARRLALHDLGLWNACRWEAFPYSADNAAILRSWGLHPVLLARYVADRGALGADVHLPPGADKLAWLRRAVVPVPDAPVAIDAERQVVAVPPMLQGHRDAEAWRRKFQVRYGGELGIDARGLTKDWLTQLADWFFAPQAGLFAASESDQAVTVFGPDVTGSPTLLQREDLRLAGRLLGKAISLGLPVHLKLANFLLAQIVGRPVGMADLASLDPLLANNLQSILAAPDVSSFDLTFAWSNRDAAGNTTTVPLLPGGETLKVTAAHAYVDLVVQYLLTTRHAEALTTFAAGLFDVVSPRVLCAFSAPELDALIAGPRHIDPAAWAAHTVVTHASTTRDADAMQARTWFFEIIDTLTPTQRARILQLVTGASGPPAGGFAQLNPPFTLNITRDEKRLPVAHTCFNTVDLPSYPTKAVMQAKLTHFLCSDLSFELQ